MLSLESVISSRKASVSHDFLSSLKTESISDSEGVHHDNIIVHHHESANIIVSPDPGFSGILSTISICYKLSNAGFFFQDIRFFDLRENDYPDLVNCFLLNMGKKPLRLSVKEKYFYQWFQAAQYL